MKTLIFARSTLITEGIAGSSVLVHNGLLFVTLFITPEMVGYSLGSFVFTRKPTKRMRK
ncbi:MAG: hypothetical protein CMJ31_07165 [Phycisphaerae bacterium]|nr:hypothetical protein [Phycisphaerae bacterium]|tara:strand:+ start:117 stop:293 length:177 start_codon:yes stop_codon:yes gene_type:complete